MSWARSVKTVGALFFAVVVAALAGGCEALISDTLPGFACTGTDPSSCPAKQICAPSLGRCVDRTGACSVLQNCAAGMRCDPGTQTCVTDGTGVDASAQDATVADTSSSGDAFQPDVSDTGFDAPDTSTCRGIGCPCTRSADCDTGICPDVALLASVVTSRICTRPCCTSSDCGSDNVCFAPGTGGNYCVPKTALGRNVTLGTTLGGATCASNADCRSGLCGASKKCLDACCVDSNCASAAGVQCAKNSETGHTVLQCVVNTPGTKGMDATCSADSDCHGGFCYNYGGGTKACVIPCCGVTTTNCGSFQLVANVCNEVIAQPTTSPVDVIPGCGTPTAGDEGGTSPLGADCVTNGNKQCKSAHCVAGKCSDVCCSDADCSAVPGWVCQPTAGTSGTFLKCGPPM